MVKAIKYRPTIRYWEKNDSDDEEPEVKRARKYGPYAVKKSSLAALATPAPRQIRPENKLLPRARKTGGRHKPIKVKDILVVQDAPDTPCIPAEELETHDSYAEQVRYVHVVEHVQCPLMIDCWKRPETETEKLLDALKFRLKNAADDWADKHEDLSTRQVAASPPSPKLRSQISRLLERLEAAEKIEAAREAERRSAEAAKKLCTPSPAGGSSVSTPASGTTVGAGTPEGDKTLLGDSTSPRSGKIGKLVKVKRLVSPASSPSAGKSKGKSKVGAGILQVLSHSRRASAAGPLTQENTSLSPSSSVGNVSATRVSARRPILAPKTVNVAIPLPGEPQSPAVQQANKPALPPPPKRGSGTSYRAQKEHRPVYMMYPQAYLQQTPCPRPIQTSQSHVPRLRSSSVLTACRRVEPDPQVPGSYPLQMEGEAEGPTPSPSRSVAAQVANLVFGMLQLVFLKSWQAVWRLTFSTRT
ncbi:hypothetical protein OE88DRAFT_1650520 [Heliocybe sulcata]|uniref:Uncharacterized protein n=1 Tax=Heliocybe sulcata TaxID=5364 RepID=A0A5C3NGX2_9AGAM|nr:hypothetical protein OE88DRAFT_1650520 [Heliocybe sulcata]